MLSGPTSFQKLMSITGVIDAVVTHVVALAYLALGSKKLGLQIVSLVNKYTCKIIELDDVISFVYVISNTVPTVPDGIHIRYPTGH